MSNEYLEQLYANLVAEQEQQKVASETVDLELFAKLAADQGIDLEQVAAQYGPDAVVELYNAAFSKSAEEKEKEHEEHETPAEEKKEEAAKKAAAYVLYKQAEFAAAQEKRAEAEVMGRMMARYYVDELQKLASRSGGELLETSYESPGPLGLTHGPKPAGYAAFRQKAHRALVSAKDSAKDIGANIKKHPWMYGAGGLGGLAAAGGVAALAHHLGKGKEKKSSADFDFLAAQEGVKMAAAAGWDVDQAVDRLSAVLTLGPTESEKIATVSDFDAAVGVRAGELLEMAGYEINW